MSSGLDVIIIDDDPAICELIAQIVKRFYTWGEVVTFSDIDKAQVYCLGRDIGVAVFVIDVFLGTKSGFSFLDAIEERFPAVHQDTIIITGNASDDVVNMCVAADVNHLLEKPVRPHALQLAIRSIVSKYINFSRKLVGNPAFARTVSKLNQRA